MVNTSEKFQQAKHRMSEMAFTQAELDFIFADWPNMDDHLDWLLNASREEIESWIKASN